MRLPFVPKWIAAELGALLTLVGAATGLLIFSMIADEVVEGETHGFDEAILLAFRVSGDPAEPIGPKWLEIMILDITSLGSAAVLGLVTLAAVVFLFMDGKRHSALFVLLAVASGTALSYLLKTGFDRPRPDLVAHLANVHTLSFPSGHAMGSAITYLTIGAVIARTERKRLLKVYVLSLAVGLTLIVGLSRIYLGVHWPTDVLAGWALGAAWALLCWFIALWLQRHGEIETGTPTTEAPTGEPMPPA